MYNSLLDEYETTQVEGTKKRRQLYKKKQLLPKDKRKTKL